MSRYNLRSKNKGNAEKSGNSDEVSGDKLKDYVEEESDGEMDLNEQARMMNIIEALLAGEDFIDDEEDDDQNQLAMQLLQSIMGKDPFEEVDLNEKQEKLYLKLEQKIEDEEPTPQRILDSKMPNSEKVQMVKSLLSYSQFEDDSMEYWMFRDMMHDSLKEWESLSQKESKEMKTLMKQVITKKSIPQQIVQLKASPEVKKGIITLYTTSNMTNHTHKSRLEMAMKIPYNRIRPFSAKGKSRHVFLRHVKDQLDAKLYGMEEVKKELLVTLNIRLTNPKGSSAILLNGKPGTGKTQCARVLAEAIGLYFYQISLGNITHPQSLTGGESIWEGSSGSIITQALIEGACKNPLILLDEIDKNKSRGNGVEHAMLQILDPTQNNNYRDLNIPEVPIDLSSVWWIATSNSTEHISKPLMSRLRLIEVPDYTTEDLKKITRDYVFPRIGKKCGIKRPVQVEDAVLHTFLSVNKDSIDSLGIRFIEGYFEKVIGSILLDEVMNERTGKTMRVTADHVLQRRKSDVGMMYL